MNFEKLSQPSKDYEQIKKENLKKIFEGNIKEWKKRKEEWEKQKKEPIERKIKKERDENEKKTCIHCGAIEHRSYNCPKLKDAEYLKEFMEKIKKKIR